MEPVRWWMEAAVFEAVSQATDEKKYTPYALENLKKMMDVLCLCAGYPSNRATEKCGARAGACLACLFDGRYASPCAAGGRETRGRPADENIISFAGRHARQLGKKNAAPRTGAALCSIEASQGIGQARSADNLSVSKNYIRLFPSRQIFSFHHLRPILMAAFDIGVHKNQSAPLKHAALFQFFIAQFNKRFLHIHKRG